MNTEDWIIESGGGEKVPVGDFPLVPFRWIGRRSERYSDAATPGEINALSYLCLDPNLNPNLQDSSGEPILSMVLRGWPGRSMARNSGASDQSMFPYPGAAPDFERPHKKWERPALALLARGADPFVHIADQRDVSRCPLSQAVVGGAYSVAMTMLALPSCPPGDALEKAQFLLGRSSKKRNLLSCVLDHEPLAMAVLDTGFDVNAANGDGSTALFHAQDEKSAAFLLARGADLGVKNSEGMTAPQHWSRTLGNSGELPKMNALAKSRLGKSMTSSPRVVLDLMQRGSVSRLRQEIHKLPADAWTITTPSGRELSLFDACTISVHSERAQYDYPAAADLFSAAVDLMKRKQPDKVSRAIAVAMGAPKDLPPQKSKNWHALEEAAQGVKLSSDEVQEALERVDSWMKLKDLPYRLDWKTFCQGLFRMVDSGGARKACHSIQNTLLQECIRLRTVAIANDEREALKPLSQFAPPYIRNAVDWVSQLRPPEETAQEIWAPLILFCLSPTSSPRVAEEIAKNIATGLNETPGAAPPPEWLDLISGEISKLKAHHPALANLVEGSFLQNNVATVAPSPKNRM